MRELDRYLSAEMGVESEDDIEAQRVFETVYDDFERLGVHQERLIQGGKFFDVVQTENTGAHLGRPYVVMQVSNPEDGKLMVYKLRSEPDPYHTTRKEMVFLARLAPFLKTKMSQELADKVSLPELHDCRDNDDSPFVLQEYFDGRIAGELQRVDPEVLGEDDVKAIAGFIQLFQSELTPERIQEMAPEIPLKDYSPYGAYSYSLPRREGMFRQNLGGDYFERLTEQLSECKDLVNGAELQVHAGDINSANIIKMPDGRLGLFDWERIHTKRGPASDYGFVFATLWSRPDLQEIFFEEASSLNADMPDFKEHLRLDFIFARGAVVLHDWLNELKNPEADPERRKLAEEAVATISAQLKDAIDRKGIWAEEEVEEK